MSIERHDIFNILHNTEIGLQDKGDGSRDFMTKGDAEKLADAIYKLNRPIANNGVSLEDIVDILEDVRTKSEKHWHGAYTALSIDQGKAIIAKLQPTVSRGGGEESKDER